MSRKQSKFTQGVYQIQNTEKYLGSKKTCIYRSSWEKTMMQHFDYDENILSWCSECVVISYQFNGKNHRYYPDFLVKDKQHKQYLIEVKPYRETKPPRNSKNKKKSTMLYEQYTFLKNQAKWEAAELYCKKRGWVFKKITERDIRL